MISLNYNHLYYFWMVAREGSIMRASQALMVSQPTVSIQLKELERVLGHKLFDRVGRGLKLTESGQIASNYAIPSRQRAPLSCGSAALSAVARSKDSIPRPEIYWMFTARLAVVPAGTTENRNRSKWSWCPAMRRNNHAFALSCSGDGRKGKEVGERPWS
jgi:hypothetical protein